MRSAAISIAAVGVFALCVESSADPRPYEVSLATIESESANPDVTGEQPSDTRSPPAEVSTSANPLWAIPISKLSATRDRPLFSASRRPRTRTVAAAPAPSPAAVAAPVVSEKPPFALVGTIVGENSRIAIFLDEASKTATGVKEGERASGWTLRSVDARSAVLEGSSRLVTLDLPEPAAQESAAPPVAAAAPPGAAPPASEAQPPGPAVMPRRRNLMPGKPGSL